MTQNIALISRSVYTYRLRVRLCVHLYSFVHTYRHRNSAHHGSIEVYTISYFRPKFGLNGFHTHHLTRLIIRPMVTERLMNRTGSAPILSIKRSVTIDIMLKLTVTDTERVSVNRPLTVKEESSNKGPFTPRVRVNSAMTLATWQTNSVAPEWCCNPFWSDSVDFKQSYIASVITALTRTLYVNGP